MNRYLNLIKNIGLFTICNIALKIITFLLTPLYTYYLTQAQYGITDMLNTVLSITIPVFTLMISDGVLRFCINDRNNSKVQKAYISVGFITILMSVALSILCLPTLDLPFFGGLGKYKFWYLICYIFLAMNTYLSNVARALDQLKVMAVSSIVTSVTTIMSAVVCIAFLRMSLYGFFISLALGYFFGVVTYFALGHYYVYFDCKLIKDARIIKPLLLYSLPLIPNSLFWWMSQGINRFFLTGMLGIAASGLFAAATKIPTILNVVSGIFQQAWNLSAFQEYTSENKGMFFNDIYKIYSIIMLLCVCILIPITPWIAHFFFKGTFYSAWRLVPVLLLAFYYSSLNAFFGSIYTASMKTREIFITTMVGAIACVVLTWVLVQSIGLQGAGVATALSNFIVLLIRYFDSKRIIKIQINIEIAILVNVILLSAAVLILRVTWIYSALLCILALSIELYGNKTVIRDIGRLGRKIISR